MAYCDWCAEYYNSRKKGMRFSHSNYDGKYEPIYATEVHTCSQECKEKMIRCLDDPNTMNQTQKPARWGTNLEKWMRCGK